MLGIDGNSPQFPDGEFLIGDDGYPNGIFTAIIEAPFDESLLSIDYKTLTPTDLSFPLEMDEDLFSYKE